MRKKLIAGALAVTVVGIPTAVATGAEESKTEKTRTKLVDQTALDKTWKRTKRVLKKKRKAARKRAAAPAIPPQLEQIAQCESGGDPQAIGGGGAYRGKYQFDTGTWQSVGGAGDPAAAPEAEQDRRAAILYARSGPSQWPVCGA